MNVRTITSQCELDKMVETEGGMNHEIVLVIIRKKFCLMKNGHRK